MAEYLPDRIFVPAEAVKELADSGTTPFYLYDQHGIEESVCALHSGFSWMPDYQNYFPLRENLNPSILRLLSKNGTGVSVCNLAELQLAQTCGFSGGQILYEPSRNDPEAASLAKALDAVWLINAPDLLPEELPQRVILRYHPSDRKMAPMQMHSVGHDKNGFTYEQLFETVKELNCSQIGLAVQVASYSIQPGFWAKKAAVLFRLAVELYEQTGVKIWSCHIGEGPGLPYRPKTDAPELKGEIEQIYAAYQQLPEDFRPVLLTGLTKRLLESHGILVTKVLEQRNGYRTFLIVDAGVCQYLRPALKQAYRHISVLGKNKMEGRKVYTVVGELPERFDRLDHKGRTLPKAAPGDYCVVHDVGCGARSMPVLYGLHPVAAEYLCEPDGNIRLIAKGRTGDEVAAFLTAL